jgi:DNA polymerase
MHNLQKPEGEANPDVALGLLDDDPNDLRLFFKRPLTVLAQSIRGFFESDQCLKVADYASIEPRGLAWSAQEQWLLEAYQRGEDVYKLAAGRVYGIHPSKVNPTQRFLGKQIILGCGYGMGPDKFILTCATKAVPPMHLSLKEAEDAVYGYRDSVPEIKAFWRNIERACIKATRKWEEVKVGRFTVRPATLPNGFQLIYIDMPSGSIAYPKPSLGPHPFRDDANSFNFWTPLGSSWIKTDTFGGSLVENIIQALTRDILRDGMIAADKAGHKIIGHAHDEAIGEGDANPADLADFEHHLCSSSPWAEGLPIKTEGYLAKCYRK